MTTRELKVSQLNNILPLVHETLKKEENLKELRKQANSIKHQISTTKKLINIGHDQYKSSLNRLFDELKICKESITEIEDFINASNFFFEGFSKMFNYGLLNCYQNGGVLEVSELNEDFLYEYAYLIQNTSSLTIYRLLSMRPVVKKKVESQMKSNLTSRKEIRKYLKLVIYYDKLL